MCGSDIPFFTGNKRFFLSVAAGAPIHECVGEVVESTLRFPAGRLVFSHPRRRPGAGGIFRRPGSRTIRGSRHGGSGSRVHHSAAVDRDERGRPARGSQGKSVAVVGLGSIGLLFCWLAAERAPAPSSGSIRARHAAGWRRPSARHRRSAAQHRGGP